MYISQVLSRICIHDIFMNNRNNHRHSNYQKNILEYITGVNRETINLVINTDKTKS